MRSAYAVLAPVAVGLGGLALWEATVRLGRVASYVLPAPSAIAEQFWASRSVVWQASLASGANALAGLVAAAVLGVLCALLVGRVRLLSEVSVPLAALINALPIIALAPVLNNMFDATSSVPRRLVVGLVAFFPIFLNTLRGLGEVQPIHRELLTSYAAGSWTFARLVRLPGALPFVFTGLRQASSLAVIAAVVAEYFGGLQDGLGARITSAAALTAYPRAWAFVVGACLLGLVFYLATLLLERISMPWRVAAAR
ncbi:ABC transporter permease [Solwaraspora sp. WMMB335]|uniref:ABC transporter permease n=1 Tax=Solwaraspora sp. WMMB335 TaxID=3404118 RepID=UPI003B94108B